MATRSVKKSRAERYREILASRGLRLEDCSVLAFSSGRSPELLHYCVMLDKRALCYLFDGAGKQVYVVTSKAPEDIKVIEEIAAECGWIKSAPDMR